MKNIIVTKLITILYRLGLILGIGFLSISVAKAADNEFIETAIEKHTEKLTYTLVRESINSTFNQQTLPNSKEISDSELMNKALNGAVIAAKNQAELDALSRCNRKNAVCKRLKVEVIDTTIAEIDTDTKMSNSGLSIEIRKDLKTKAKVRVTVVGSETVATDTPTAAKIDINQESKTAEGVVAPTSPVVTSGVVAPTSPVVTDKVEAEKEVIEN